MRRRNIAFPKRIPRPTFDNFSCIKFRSSQSFISASGELGAVPPSRRLRSARKKHVLKGVKACNFTILRKGANSGIVKIPYNFTRT